jgi:hypothetical protein
MARARTGTVFNRGGQWRGAITVDGAITNGRRPRRYFYGRSEEEVRAKMAAAGAPLVGSHRPQADGTARRATAIEAVLDRAALLGWDRSFTALVLATNITASRIAAGVSGPCEYCGNELAATVDHVDPLSRGGATDAANVVSACTSCNARKGTRAAP